MKRVLQISVCIFGGLSVLALLAVGGLLLLIPMLGEDTFRSDFGRIDEAYTTRTDAERALSFGGASGLKRLSKLTEDASIAPPGRKVAASLLKYIQSKQHVADLREELDQSRKNGFPMTLRKYYACFVIWKDGN